MGEIIPFKVIHKADKPPDVVGLRSVAIKPATKLTGKYPLYQSSVKGLRKGIKLLSREVALPDDLETKVRYTNYRLEEDGIILSRLTPWEQTFLALKIFEGFHDGWASLNIDKIFSVYYGEEGTFFPFLLSGEMEFWRVFNGDMPQLLWKLGLGDVLLLNNNLISFPEGLSMFLTMRNIYCESLGLCDVDSLKVFIKEYATRRYSELAPSIVAKIVENDRITDRIAKDLTNRNPGKFEG